MAPTIVTMPTMTSRARVVNSSAAIAVSRPWQKKSGAPRAAPAWCSAVARALRAVLGGGVWCGQLTWVWCGLATWGLCGQAAWGLCGQAAWGEDWPAWRGPRGDGTWNGPNLPVAWPATGLPVIWRAAIGGGYSGVVVADGRVVVLDRQPAPSEVERVICFDAGTGQSLWVHAYPVSYGKLDYGNGPRAAATLAAGHVFTLGALGQVCCLDVTDGRLLWQHDLVAEYGATIPTWGLAASPVVWKSWVLIHGGVPGGTIIAFDRDTGREAWRGGSDPAGYATPRVHERGNQVQVVCWSPEQVLGLAADSGDILWRVPYKVTYGVSIAAPLCVGDWVLVSGYWEGTKAIRLGARPDEATLAWEDKTHLQGLMSQPLERDGYVYLLDKSEGLTCFELTTGQKLWDDDHRLTERGRNPQASLVWLGQEDRALALNAAGELVQCRLNPTGYTELARVKLLGDTWAHPAWAGRRVYARSDTELVCAELLPE